MPAARAYSYSNMAEKVVEVEQENKKQSQCFTKNAFLAEVQRYDCVYNKGSKDFKNKYTLSIIIMQIKKSLICLQYDNDDKTT